MEQNNKFLRRCALCKSRFNYKTFKFFKTPSCYLKRQRWVEACGVDLKKTDLICQNHFTAADFINEPGCSAGKVRLQPGALPMVHATTPERIFIETTSESLDMETEPTHISSSTQTLENFMEQSFRAEIMVLREKVKQLNEENASLRMEIQKNATLYSSISKIFTKGQIRKLENPEKKVFWDSEDISSAICLHAESAKAYRHLYDRGFPWPHFGTLSAWAKKIRKEEGVLSCATECLKSRSNLPDDEKF